MVSEPSAPQVGCFKGCALGCLVVAILGVASAALVSRVVVGPFKTAIASRAQIEERFGRQGDYTPAGDGVIAPERVRAFLAVRAALAPVCSRLGALAGEFNALEALGEEREPTKVETMRQAFATTQAAFTIAPLMGEYFAVRNQALLDADMGLGEYTYLYTVAYCQRFAAPSAAPLLGGKPLNRRVRALVVEMLQRQRQGASDDQGGLATALDRELGALAADPQRTPWPQGPPAAVAGSLAPYRAALDAAYCAESAGIDLLENRERRFGIESE
jgi:hypothetical protein